MKPISNSSTIDKKRTNGRGNTIALQHILTPQVHFFVFNEKVPTGGGAIGHHYITMDYKAFIIVISRSSTIMRLFRSNQ